MKTIFPKIKKDALSNNIIFHEILLMKIMFFLYLFFAKLGEICEIHGNRSLWVKVTDTVNGMYLFTITVIIFHGNILPLGTWIRFCFFFFTQRYSKYLENASKIFFQ